MTKLEELSMADVMLGLTDAEDECLHSFIYEKEKYPDARKRRLEFKFEYERRLYGR